MKTLKHLLDKNKHWAEKINKEDPEFFKQLSMQQAPEYLWIGCADSRVPATQIVDLAPGEMFVHRNIGNMVVHTDLNCLSVIQYAVDVLEVKHIIICGHYGCGAVDAALDDHDHGLIDNWLRHIVDVKRLNADKLVGLNAQEQNDLLCELNISEQVKNVCNTTIVKNAWKRGAKLSIHGWIYDIHNGVLEESIPAVTCLEDIPL